MFDTDQNDQSVANHTLALLHRFDKRLDQLTDLSVRQQELIGRLERDTREGFSLLERDMREMKSDMIVMENRTVSTIASDHFAQARLNDHEERPDALEARRPIS